MAQVNKYADRAAYTADAKRLSTKSAVSFIENETTTIYDGVNTVVGKSAAAIGDLAVFDKTDGVIKYIKSATIAKAQIPANLVPLAVVYARQGEQLLIVSLDHVSGSIRWAHTYEVALSGFDLAAGGTIVLKLGSDPAAAEVSIAYTAGATLADVASAINAKLKGGTPNYSSTDYGGWAATAADNFVVMGSNTYNASRAAIAVVGGCQIARTPEDINYQTTLTGVLIEGSTEYVRRNNGVNSSFAGCNPEKFLQYYSANGSDTTGIKPGSSTIIRESAFTEEANPELVAAYRCILSKFYIKPQRRNAGHGNTFGCILSKFYIKPQRVRPIRISLIVVSYRNSTSNHNRTTGKNINGAVVSYRNSTSNHNYRGLLPILLYVVSYRNSTSNHNVGGLFGMIGAVVSYRNSTSNHNLYEMFSL